MIVDADSSLLRLSFYDGPIIHAKDFPALLPTDPTGVLTLVVPRVDVLAVLILLQTKAMSILRLLLILNFVGLSYPISECLWWIMSKFARPEVGEAKLPVYS